MSHYKFSLAWSRILPNGTVQSKNQAGIEYYRQLIDALIDSGIEPVVTLNYWDLPQALQNSGGWLDNHTVTLFNEFSRLCFEEYGNRVYIKSISYIIFVFVNSALKYFNRVN